MTFLELKLAEKPHSGDSNEARHKYILRCTGETDEDVYNWLATDRGAPDVANLAVERPDGTFDTGGYPIILGYANLLLSDIQYKLDRDRDPELYRITAIYKNEDAGGGSGSPRVDPGTASPVSVTLGVEYAPENIVYRTSLDTWTVYSQDFLGTEIPAPFMNQAVNVQPDGTIQGTTAPDPGAIETLSYVAFPAFFTTARRKLISESRGKVNNVAFTATGISYPAGSVRFLGANGSISSTGESTVDFRFGIRENVTDLEVEGIWTTGSPHINYDGWDYFWVLYAKGVDAAGLPTSQPRGGYVERLFPRMDLNALFS